MELAGLDPATSWVRSEICLSAETRLSSSRYAGDPTARTRLNAHRTRHGPIPGTVLETLYRNLTVCLEFV
jgi:hypothetical protein